ncbi:DUF551 domain-containing protein [Pseudomonas protegens]|uniref:DUF551 domain-containing protein n=1 Tax=Pseudomonas protegens TaxID=380021 RepID=UPI00380CE053
MSDWIKVSDRNPPFRKTVLLIGVNVGASGDYTTDQYVGWLSADGFSRWPHPFPPTHWQPLPAPPAE